MLQKWGKCVRKTKTKKDISKEKNDLFFYKMLIYNTFIEKFLKK